jgi:NAD(P)-dependent dehydrogenase (short-subunit alcohol dehydrogenase family)
MTIDDKRARLAGRRVLITGASSGVGLAATLAFAREGARLALISRNPAAIEPILLEHGVQALILPADLADRDATERAVEDAVGELGGLDIVVSNAAAAVFGHVLEVDPDDFDRTVAVTFTGAVNVIRAALPHLRESRGTVVATGSLMARAPLPTWSAYAAAKHALRGFLTSLQIEELEQRSGVRCAMVHPGPIDTPFFAHATSGTARTPRVPPDAYRPEVIAQALVEVAIRPRAETVLGGETVIMDLLDTYARPVSQRILMTIDRWYRSGDQPSPDPGALWRTPERPSSSGGIPGRDSLLAPLQLGRRMLPDPLTPLRIAQHLARAGRRAVQLAPALTQPVAERRWDVDEPAQPRRTEAARVSV